MFILIAIWGAIAALHATLVHFIETHQFELTLMIVAGYYHWSAREFNKLRDRIERFEGHTGAGAPLFLDY